MQNKFLRPYHNNLFVYHSILQILVHSPAVTVNMTSEPLFHYHILKPLSVAIILMKNFLNHATERNSCLCEVA